MQKRQNAKALEPDADRQPDTGEEQSLEALFAQVEALIGRMEEPDLPLEEAFDAYEKGMKMIRACNSRIDRVEQCMLMMNEAGELEPFGEE